MPRALPEALAARLDLGSWPEPSVTRLVATLGDLGGPEMRATLNAGIGMVAVVPEAAVEPARTFLAGRGLTSWRVGNVIPASEAGPDRYVEVGQG